MKIVINKCFGGFGLSYKACKEYLKRQGKECFCYKQTKFKHSEGCDEFQLTDKGRMFHITVTKNLGDVTNNIPDDVHFFDDDIKRTDPDLIAVVEELGEEANGDCAELSVIEIPDDVEYDINDYDGIESVHEIHRVWG